VIFVGALSMTFAKAAALDRADAGGAAPGDSTGGSKGDRKGD